MVVPWHLSTSLLLSLWCLRLQHRLESLSWPHTEPYMSVSPDVCECIIVLSYCLFFNKLCYTIGSLAPLLPNPFFCYSVQVPSPPQQAALLPHLVSAKDWFYHIKGEVQFII